MLFMMIKLILVRSRYRSMHIDLWSTYRYRSTSASKLLVKSPGSSHSVFASISSSARQYYKRFRLHYGLLAATFLGSGVTILMNIGQWPEAENLRKSFQSLLLKLAQGSFETWPIIGYDDDWFYHLIPVTPLSSVSNYLPLYSSVLPSKRIWIWDWLFPWEQSKSDDPWVLLQLTRSSNFWIRQMGVASIANKVNWADYKCREIAQACDHRTTVALARYPYAKDAFFLPPPRLHTSENDILTDLRLQITQLPVPSSPASCIQYYRAVALQQDVRFQQDPLTMDTVPHYALPGEDEKKKERALGYCLEAIAAYTEVPEYAGIFVENQGLSVLQRVYEESEELVVQMYIATILSNLSQLPELLNVIVRTGWIYILRQWSRSKHAALSLLTLTTLANLDRDWTSKALYQDIVLLHPTQRNSRPVKADIIFVHGLRGGAVKTWRQRDSSKTDDNPSISPCWPRDWLASDCPNVRIISIGYNSLLHMWGDHCPYELQKRTLEGRSKDLMKKLKNAGVGSQPVIWIGHSMGGLLIKHFLSMGEKECNQFTSQTKGIIMFSVPHHGSTVVDVMMYAKYLLFPSVEVQELHTNSPQLSSLHQQFVSLMSKNSIPLLSFGENAKTAMGRPLPKILVVPLDSSDPGIGHFISIPANHINTCKPCGEDDLIYQSTLTFIQNILDKLD